MASFSPVEKARITHRRERGIFPDDATVSNLWQMGSTTCAHKTEISVPPPLLITILPVCPTASLMCRIKPIISARRQSSSRVRGNNSVRLREYPMSFCRFLSLPTMLLTSRKWFETTCFINSSKYTSSHDQCAYIREMASLTMSINSCTSVHRKLKSIRISGCSRIKKTSDAHKSTSSSVMLRHTASGVCSASVVDTISNSGTSDGLFGDSVVFASVSISPPSAPSPVFPSTLGSPFSSTWRGASSGCISSSGRADSTVVGVTAPVLERRLGVITLRVAIRRSLLLSAGGTNTIGEF
mmetsp:Transcript_10203/g.15455  ORF Transcript_10203/g.15455 Transcript_10203/m.15455 type:complete len:297 (-) Transcript_10203:2923-3813(-)